VSLLLLPTLASAQWEPAYEAVVRRYASGDREGAIVDMGAWPEGRLRSEITAVNALRRKASGCRDCPAASAWEKVPLTAALMLHTDCAIRARRDGASPRLHESAAVELAGLLKDDPARRAFAGRWFEAVAALAYGESRWNEALDSAERGLRDFPGSARLLFVQGALEEALGVQAAPRELGEDLVDPNTRRTRTELLHRHEVQDHLEKARRALRSAVAADPSLLPARLRLGRIAWKLGETAEARSVLEEVLGRNPPADAAFLAHLFLGRLEEDDGHLDGAARSYESALALDARCQSARLALSHVRLRQGDAAAARRDVETTVQAAVRRPRQDGFWLYPWGPSIGAEDRLEELRREASVP
jgi:tetratricopeptide (TPR) repeat protein